MISHDQAQTIANSISDIGFLGAYQDGVLSGLEFCVPGLANKLDLVDVALDDAEELVVAYLREHYPIVADAYDL